MWSQFVPIKLVPFQEVSLVLVYFLELFRWSLISFVSLLTTCILYLPEAEEVKSERA